MNMLTNDSKFIYSRSFIIKAHLLDISQICPEEITSLNIDLQNISLEIKHGETTQKSNAADNIHR